MTRETLDAHYGEIGRAVDGTLPGCSYSREVVFDVEQDPDMDYLGALTCVEDVLTDNMLEIPVDKVISGSGSPATNYPRAAIASAVPPTPHYYIQMAMFANQGSDDSYLGIYARYTAIPSGSPEIGDAQYYLLKIFPYVSTEGGSVFQLIRGSYGGSTTVIATEVHAPFFGYAKFRWDLSGGSHIVKDMLGAVLGPRTPVLTATNSSIRTAGSVGLVVMDGTLTGRDIKIDEVKAAAIAAGPFATPDADLFGYWSREPGRQRCSRLNAAGDMAMFGIVNDQAAPGGGFTTPSQNGGAAIYKVVGGVWTQFALALPYVNDWNLFNNGLTADMADDGTVVTCDSVGPAVHVFDTDGVTWTEQATLEMDGFYHQAINDGASLPASDLESVVISRDGTVLFAYDAPGNEQYGFIYTRSGLTWTLAQTIDLGGALFAKSLSAADISVDGNVIAILLYDSTAGYAAVEYRCIVYQTLDHVTWSQTDSLVLSTTHSSYNLTGAFPGAENFGVALAGASPYPVIVIGAATDPSFGGGYLTSTLFVLTGSPGSYSQVAYMQNPSIVTPATDEGVSMGGMLSLSDDGITLIVGDPFSGPNNEGRVRYIDNPGTLSGLQDYLAITTLIPNPNEGVVEAWFGTNVATNADGSVFAIQSGDWGALGISTVHFRSR